MLAFLAVLACHGEPPARGIERASQRLAPAVVTIPDDAILLEQIEEALELRRQSELDRLLDALEPGEALEHATLTQAALDRGIFGADALFAVGDELFEYEFRSENGLGNDLRRRPGVRAGSSEAPNLRRVHKGDFGGPDAHSCATCHAKGGPDGAGTATQNAYLRGDGRDANSADVRSPPHLLGLGPIEALATEMSRELQAVRDQALARARAQSREQEVVLESKGVSFGILVVRPNGSVINDRVVGVDPDLVIKPFGWKGHQSTLRAMIEESFRIHMGIVSTRQQELLRDGRSEHDKANLGDGPWSDVDRDGVSLEIDSGMLTTMVAYLAQLETPVVRPPRDDERARQFSRGQTLFDEIGCGQCHRPSLVLRESKLVTRPLAPSAADRAALVIDVARDGESPKIEPSDQSFVVRLYSDLRRHDMGPELSSGFAQAHLPATVFLTRPLWGLAETAPYLHDGRAPTIHDAIAWHGGESRTARDRYLGLDADERSALLVFLHSLTREPKLFVP